MQNLVLFTLTWKLVPCLKIVSFYQGKGMSMVLGIANVPTVDISLMALLSGKTLKGCFFGGIKVQSDIPVIVDKCINKASSLVL